MKQSNLDQTVDRHIKCLVTTAKELLKKFPGGKIFVTADIVAYGSFTWGSAVNALGNRDASWTKRSRKQWFHFIMSSKNGNKTRLQEGNDLHCSFTACDC